VNDASGVSSVLQVPGVNAGVEAEVNVGSCSMSSPPPKIPFAPKSTSSFRQEVVVPTTKTTWSKVKAMYR
jgi:hypothetical protein